MALHGLKRLSLFAAALALCVVVLGAYVRLSDAGLGCPDWPGCYGTLTVPDSEAAILQAQNSYPDSPIEAAKAWKEMVHRYFAGTLGLLVLAIFILAYRSRQEIKVNIVLPAGLLVLIVLQALLGMWTVTLLLKPMIVSAHLLGGMMTLALLTWLAHRHWDEATGVTMPSALKKCTRGAGVILLLQIFLGGWTSTNYAALACTDFPTCHGFWWPEMDFTEAFYLWRELGHSTQGGYLTLSTLTAIQWTHRIGAYVTLAYLGFLALSLWRYSETKKLAGLLIVVLLTQVSLGVANLLLQLPLVLAVAHNLGAALLVVITVLLNSKITPHKNHALQQ